jgi:hypothetical protein
LAALFAIAIFLIGAVFSFASSCRFDPDPGGDEQFIDRAQQKVASNIIVSASALGPSESRRSFGENLADYGIQPVWLSIENETDDAIFYLPIVTDPFYYSPYEVSYRFHGLLSFEANRARDAYFLARQMPNVLPPHSRTKGFVYGVLDAGMKYTRVLLLRRGNVQKLDFALPVPGQAFLGANIRAEVLYPVVKDLDLDALKAVLSTYPCCTTNSAGTRNGDPLNIAIVEDKGDPIVPFAATNWHLTQILDIKSAIETARAFIFREQYLTSPVSPLYVFGRSEDIALQRARSTINERIHMRLWLTPYTFESRRVWIGQVSRDIGVRLTDQVWNLTTHKIAPDVDFDRDYLLQDLAVGGFVERYAYVTGVGAAKASEPRANLTGDPYYTDGLRLVIFLTNQQKPMSEIEKLNWETPPEPGKD